MTMYVSKPSAALMHILEWAELSNVGNQRLSRVSMSRNTTSCDWTSRSIVSTSLRAFSMALAGLKRVKRKEREREGGKKEGREASRRRWGRDGERGVSGREVKVIKVIKS